MFDELASVVPGSAGFFYDRHGGLIVMLRDSAQQAGARAKVGNLVAAGKIPPPTGSLAFRRAEFSFNELATWRDIAFDSVLTQADGVVSLDLDEAANRVTIGVLESQFSSVRTEALRTLARSGVNPAAVNFERSTPVTPRRAATMSNPASRVMGGQGPHLTQSFDTLVGGIAYHLLKADGTTIPACSMGIVGDWNGSRVMVSASHCTDIWFQNEDSFIREGNSSTTVIGEEIFDPPGYNCGTDICRASDAAVFSIYPIRVGGRGLIARTQYRNGGYLAGGLGSLFIDLDNPYFMVTAVENNDLFVGTLVDKVGTTTGWTWGDVTDTCEDVTMSLDDGSFNFQSKVTRCTYRAGLVVDGGDSGGPVFQRIGYTDEVKFLGTVVAMKNDRMVFSKWHRIQSDLGPISITRAGTIPAPSINSIGYTVDHNPELGWTPVSGATSYRVVRTTWPCNGPSERATLGETATLSWVDDAIYSDRGGYGQGDAGNCPGVQYNVYAIRDRYERSDAGTAAFFNSIPEP